MTETITNAVNAGRGLDYWDSPMEPIELQRGPHDAGLPAGAESATVSAGFGGSVPTSAEMVSARVMARHRDLRVTTDDGVVLAVRDTGSRKPRRTVVFLHGFCLTWVSWARQIDYLTRQYGQSVRVISYDHRGHGRSGQAPMGSYRIERLAEDLAQVLTATRVDGPVTLVGHSMGGMVALAYLARSEADRPVDPDGLVLVATAAGKLAERGLGRLLATPATAALFGLVEHAPEHAVRAMARPVCATLGRWRRGASSTTATALAVAALTSTSVSTAVGFLPSLRAYDQYGELASIQARTVVVSGGVDPLTPPAHGRDLSAGIPSAEHVHLPRAGHMLPQEAPHVLNAAIRRAMGIGDGARRARLVIGEIMPAAPVAAGAAS
jgi:pimeloyl-ACP methyl ester carboxylesterase